MRRGEGRVKKIIPKTVLLAGLAWRGCGACRAQTAGSGVKWGRDPLMNEGRRDRRGLAGRQSGKKASNSACKKDPVIKVNILCFYPCCFGVASGRHRPARLRLRQHRDQRPARNRAIRVAIRIGHRNFSARRRNSESYEYQKVRLFRPRIAAAGRTCYVPRTSLLFEGACP